MNLSVLGLRVLPRILALGTWQGGVGHTLGPHHQEHSLGLQLRDRPSYWGGGYLS